MKGRLEHRFYIGGVLVLVALLSPLFGAAGTPKSQKNNSSSKADPSNEPDKFAWQLFAEINRPANNGTNDAVWETWALEQLVFADPNKAPIWPSGPSAPIHTNFTPIKQLQILKEELLEQNPGINLENFVQQNPKLKPQFFPESPEDEEVRMNKTAFDFVVVNDLWFVEGQEAAFQAGKQLEFPADAKEIKAIWKEIDPSIKSKYHWQFDKQNGKTYGLIALHIISKDLANWTWATYEQVDNPKRCVDLGCRDSFGLAADGQPSQELLSLFKANGLGSEWANYRLDGTQTNFVDATGRTTLLGNSITEDGFITSSSCITCHARATVGLRAPGQTKANRLSVFKSVNPPVSDNGAPDPNWFYSQPNDPKTLKFLQLDFLWSLRNAKAKGPK